MLMRRLWLIGLLLLCASGARAADTVTSGTLTRPDAVTVFPDMIVETWTLTSDSAGRVTATIQNVRGTVRAVIYAPATGGTKPSDNFDLTLKDDLGSDILAGLGSNVDADAPSRVVPTVDKTLTPETGDGEIVSAPMTTFGDLTLAVTNLGSGKTVTIRLHIAPEF